MRKKKPIKYLKMELKAPTKGNSKKPDKGFDLILHILSTIKISVKSEFKSPLKLYKYKKLFSKR